MAVPTMLRVTEREVRVFSRLWRASVGLAFVQPVLFLTAIGIGLGGLVDQHRGDVDGVPYLTFIAPGLLVANAMLVAGSEALWALMARLKWLGSYKAMVATPIRPRDTFGGWLIWIAVRTTIAALAFLLVAALLGAVPSPWGIAAVAAADLCAVAVAAPIAAFSATQETDVRFPVLMRLGLFPLFLFSGTFFPVEQLPDHLEWLAWLSPLWHGVELARGAMTADIDAAMTVSHVGVLTALLVVGCRVGTRTFSRRLAP